MPPVTHEAKMFPRPGEGAKRARPLPSRLVLVAEAYLQLVKFEGLVRRGNFLNLYDHVRDYPLGDAPADPDPIGRVCAAVDHASIWYPKQILCLQRSAATACLLKRFGIQATLVVGVQHLPFKAHAWVEVGGRVVNDKPYVREMFAVLDRC